jgi:hypothetical protein
MTIIGFDEALAIIVQPGPATRWANSRQTALRVQAWKADAAAEALTEFLERKKS